MRICTHVYTIYLRMEVSQPGMKLWPKSFRLSISFEIVSDSFLMRRSRATVTWSDPLVVWRGEAREPQAKLCFYHVYTIHSGILMPVADPPFPNIENALNTPVATPMTTQNCIFSAKSALQKLRAFMESDEI